MNQEKFIAERRLLFGRADDPVRKELTIRIAAPRILDPDSVSFRFDEGTAACSAVFEGLDVPHSEVYGIDTLQALRLASDIDPILRGLQKKHDVTFFFPDGDTYFD
ncbi:hypothetical protein [Lysobacter firmicutimachus]|uniref:Uncharacterized protein n=1 Tax=Lysobacter firmicutimachus TaxID=1792846 RepID=A0ABU8D0L1_9GAMM